MELDSPTPIHIIQDNRYARQDGWELDDISLCSSGNIAVSGSRPYQSYVYIYSGSDNSDSRDEPTFLYHKQFTHKVQWWPQPYISFIKPNSTEIVTCQYDKVEVIDYNRDVVLRSRKENGYPSCVSVSESQIFIGLLWSNYVNIYCNDLKKIKSIRLNGIRGDWPRVIAAAADRLYVCTVRYDRAIVFNQFSGKIITEFNTGQYCKSTYYISLAVNIRLQKLAAVWGTGLSQKGVSVHSFSNNNCLVNFKVESGVTRIRISDRGRIVTGNKNTGVVTIFDLEEPSTSYNEQKLVKTKRQSMDVALSLIKEPIPESDSGLDVGIVNTAGNHEKVPFDEHSEMSTPCKGKSPKDEGPVEDFSIYQFCLSLHSEMSTPCKGKSSKDEGPVEEHLEKEQPSISYKELKLVKTKRQPMDVALSLIKEPISESDSGLDVGTVNTAETHEKVPFDEHPEMSIPCKSKSPKDEGLVEEHLEKLTTITGSRHVVERDPVQVGNHGMTNSLCTEKVINEEGGTLFLPEADISLHVPRNALDGSHLISIIVPLDPSHYAPSREIDPRFTPLTICKPDNIHFKLPVTLTLPHCAVVKNPTEHKIEVRFGENTENCSKEMMWKSEKVDYSLGEHYCSIYLYHFSGVDVAIKGVKDKILRVIPYTKLGHENKQVLSVWLCNDLEPDFRSIIRTEEENEGIPLDSYDTFRLRCIQGQGETKVEFNLDTYEDSYWIPEENQDVIDVHRLSSGTKSKCSFRLNGREQDDDSYMYLFLRVSQMVGDVRRETTFAIRKRICDLRMNVKFKKPCSQNGQQAEHVFTTENLPRICTAVVYMDPVRNVNDDAIITLWLSPFDSATGRFKLLQQEQELQLKHRVDTENSFSIFDENIAVVTKTTFRNGQWRLSPEEKRIETDRIRYGSRVKFQFIGKRKENDDSTYIDLQVETFQEGKNKIKFMTDVEIILLLYEKRMRNTKELGVFVKEEVNNVSEEDNASLHCYPVAANKGEHTQQTTAASASLKQRNENPGLFEENPLQRPFLILKDSLADEWKNFGRHLGLPDDDLSRISIEQKDDVKEAIYKMLLCWQQRKGSDAILETLTQKLREIFRRDLAEKLERL